MEQFNLEEYLRNPDRKIVTRDGRSARIICTDAKKAKGEDDQPIIALVYNAENEGEDCRTYYPNGSFLSEEAYSLDLFFAPIKHEGWIDEVEPVPLTKEIMDANLDQQGGWRCDGLRYTWENTFTKSNHLNVVDIDFVLDQAILSVYERDSTIFHLQEPRILGMKISYVHELQNALRLVGLNELADSLKVRCYEKDRIGGDDSV